MGNKTEEVKLQKEIDDLDEKEIEINLELYKLQKEVNNRLPEDQQKKLKKDYINIINKLKNKNKPKEKKEIKVTEDPFEKEEFDSARNQQKEWNKKNEKEKEKEKNNKNKKDDKSKNNKKNKEHFLDSGIPKLKNRIKELEDLDKEDEINETRKNKEKIKRDYIKELNQAEQDLFEEDVKDEIIKNKMDNPDINDILLDEKLSELYNDLENNDKNDYSVYEDNYSNDYKLYKDIVKENNLKKKLDEVKVTFFEPEKKDKDNDGLISEENNSDSRKNSKDNNSEIKYEYKVERNKKIEEALFKRNHIVKNGDILKEDNSPYSNYEPSEDNNIKEQSDKSDNLSQYY